MRILFTKNNTFVSKSIRTLTQEPVSHVVLEVGSFIVHSNFRGVHIEWANNFKKKSTVVYSVEIERTPLDDIRLNDLLEKYEFSMYDFGGMLFMGVALWARANLRIPLSKSNLWQSSGMFLCTEWINMYLDIEKDSMITPYKLYLKLKKS